MTTTLNRAKHLSWRRLGDHTIILDSKINQEVHHVNDLGSFLWELIDGTYTKEKIITEILNEYDVTEEVAQKDLEDFLNKLSELNLLEITNE